MKDLLLMVSVFFGAFVIGYFLVSRVPPRLHTPLMSMTNAISAVTILGGILLFATGLSVFQKVLGVSGDCLGGLQRGRRIRHHRPHVEACFTGITNSGGRVFFELIDFAIIVILIVGIWQFTTPVGARSGNLTAAFAILCATVLVWYAKTSAGPGDGHPGTGNRWRGRVPRGPAGQHDPDSRDGGFSARSRWHRRIHHVVR